MLGLGDVGLPVSQNRSLADAILVSIPKTGQYAGQARISHKRKKHAIKSVAQAQISFNKVQCWTVATVLSLS